MAFLDYDNDGDIDIVVNTNPGDHGPSEMPPVLLRNDIGQKRNWLSIRLVGKQSNADAIGAEVRIHSGDLKALRHVHAGSGYASQSDSRLFFGLNDNTTVDAIEVKWPSGLVQTFDNVAASRHMRLEEGGVLEEVKPPVFNDAKVAHADVESTE